MAAGRNRNEEGRRCVARSATSKLAAVRLEGATEEAGYKLRLPSSRRRRVNSRRRSPKLEESRN
eukprot:COSAG03_NODE_531_length_7114_cov_467.466714_5_plen_64_part_00